MWTNNDIQAIPAWTIPYTTNLGAPSQIKIVGDLLAINLIDNSLKVYRLRANGNFEKISELAGEVAQASKFEMVMVDASRVIITSMFNVKQFDAELLQLQSDIIVPGSKFAHSIAVVSI